MLEQQKQYFSLEEANEMIPRLEKAFARILQMRGQIQRIHDRLEQAGVVEEEPEPEGLGQEQELPPPLMGQRATMHGLIEAVEEEIAQLHENGCLVKGLDPALVDWYAKREEEDIFLCWKLGEQEVKWWHGIRAGFKGRRPVSEL